MADEESLKLFRIVRKASGYEIAPDQFFLNLQNRAETPPFLRGRPPCTRSR
ncbi:hypothetical protein [Bosea sp. LC85]|uniref:hypothetical protein n=1 Tax=Bosea sp. LC85 TaxID=1502851 RepID=UPI000AF3CAF4|nr:hypothetical protein [Bosea sp. LC85]